LHFSSFGYKATVIFSVWSIATQNANALGMDQDPKENLGRKILSYS